MVTSSAGTLNRPRTRHTSVRKDLCIFSPSATCRQTNKKYKIIRNNWKNFRTWWVHWREAKWLMKTWGTLSPTTGSPRLTTREILPPSWKKKNLFTHFNSDRYLTGNQLNSESSVDAYINTLKQGCRCVECENLSFHLKKKKTYFDILSGLLGRQRWRASDLPRPHNCLQDIVQGCGRSVQKLCLLKVSVRCRRFEHWSLFNSVPGQTSLWSSQ